MLKETIILSLNSSKQLSQEIANDLDIPLAPCEVKHFADGEILIEVGESVRGKNVYIIQSTCNPVNDNLMELLICIDACKRASAKSITAIIPYFGYARQDRKAKARQPITAKLVADMLTTAGVSRVVSVDLHAAQISGFFNVPIDDMTAIPMIAQYFRSKHFNEDEVVVVAPDHGGTGRARRVADGLNCPLAIIDKRRPRPNVAEAMNIIGDVQDKVCIIIDDIIDTAGTLVAGVDILVKHGAKSVYAAASHGVLSGPAVERLVNSPLKEVIITNTIAASEDKKFDKLTILTVSHLLSKTIESIENATPVSAVFEMFND